MKLMHTGVRFRHPALRVLVLAGEHETLLRDTLGTPDARVHVTGLAPEHDLVKLKTAHGLASGCLVVAAHWTLKAKGGAINKAVHAACPSLARASSRRHGTARRVAAAYPVDTSPDDALHAREGVRTIVQVPSRDASVTWLTVLGR